MSEHYRSCSLDAFDIGEYAPSVTREATVALVATLDTKSQEAEYLAQRLSLLGAKVRLYDTSVLGAPDGLVPEVSSAEVAASASVEIESIRSLRTRGEAVEIMARGLATLLPRDCLAGRFDRAIVIGGLNGALLGAAALQRLPFGVPKLIVTPLASGERTFAPFVGTSDIAVMHSVVDLQGINSFTRSVLDNAAMMMSASPYDLSRPTQAGMGSIAITLNGNTTPVGTRIMESLSASGWEAVAFHSNGVGGSAMERLASEGRFFGVIDLTTNEIVERELQGTFAVPDSRMRLLAHLGLPTVFVPGCMDFVCLTPEALSSRPGRLHVRHSRDLELVRVTASEATRLAEVFADSVNEYTGSVEVVIPMRGFSPSAAPGGLIADPAADDAFINTLRSRLSSSVPITEVDAPINDPAIAKAVVKAFERVAESCAVSVQSDRVG